MPESSTCPAIWMYWDDAPGRSRSGYLRVCEQTVRLHAGEIPVRLVSKSTLEHWVGPVRAEFDRLTLNHRSDYARTRLVLAHGGLWLDMDTIAVRPLHELYEQLGKASFLGYGDEGTESGTFAAPRHSPVVEAWAMAQDIAIDLSTDPSRLAWNALGCDLLTPTSTDKTCAMLPQKYIAPVTYPDWREFLSRTLPVSRVLEANPYIVTLYNALLSPSLSSIPAYDIVRSRYLVGRLLRIGLGYATQASSDDFLTRFARLGHLNLYRHRRREVRARLRNRRS